MCNCATAGAPAARTLCVCVCVCVCTRAAQRRGCPTQESTRRCVQNRECVRRIVEGAKHEALATAADAAAQRIIFDPTASEASKKLHGFISAKTPKFKFKKQTAPGQNPRRIRGHRFSNHTRKFTPINGEMRRLALVAVAAVAATWGAAPACLVDGSMARVSGQESLCGCSCDAACLAVLLPARRDGDGGARTDGLWPDARLTRTGVSSARSVQVLRGGSSYAAVAGSGGITTPTSNRAGRSRRGSGTHDSQYDSQHDSQRESQRLTPGNYRRHSPPGGSAKPSRIKPLGAMRTPRQRVNGGESEARGRRASAGDPTPLTRRLSANSVSPNRVERLVGAVSF
jgi:hypothetical protein